MRDLMKQYAIFRCNNKRGTKYHMTGRNTSTSQTSKQIRK